MNAGVHLAPDVHPFGRSDRILLRKNGRTKASTKMEGFVVTEEHRELIMKLMSGEITTDDVFEVLKKKYE